MREVRLPKGNWQYDESALLGPPGGFGAVFRGLAEDGAPVAVKRLNSAYKGREMHIAEFLMGHGLAHVIPIVDAGLDEAEDKNFIIMPIAEMSLQKRIGLGPIGEPEALDVLASIAAGLDEIGDIIHRDLKPGNVLLHEGVWKLADLGLARFAERTTSANTMRRSGTPSYAAPEQFRQERPQKLTDVYALGCIAYALLTGAPPFAGPDYGHQHQFEVPPALDASARYRRITAACLAKSPRLRPSIPELRQQFAEAAKTIQNPSAAALAEAAAIIRERSLREEQEQIQRERDRTAREQLAAEAVQNMNEVLRELEAAVLREAPDVSVSQYPYDERVRMLRLDRSGLHFGVKWPNYESTNINPSLGIHSHWGANVGSNTWDILAGGFIEVIQGYYSGGGRSANLWFGKLVEGDDFRWWEVSYSRGPGSTRGRRSAEPYKLDNLQYDLSDSVVAEDPVAITPFGIDEFIERWMLRFSQYASASQDFVFDPFVRRSLSAKFNLDEAD